MDAEHILSSEERQWLHALNLGPLSTAAAQHSVPEAVRSSLLEKRLVRWKHGYLGMTLLEITERGAAEVERARSRASAKSA